MRTLGFTGIMEGISSTHRGIFTNLYNHQPSKDTSSKEEYRSQRRWYNLPKVLCIREKLTRLWMWRTQSDNNPAMDLAIHDRVDVIIGNQSDEEGDAKALAYRNVWMIRCLGTKELWFQDEGSEAEALIKRWISWIDLEVHPIKSGLGKNWLISGRMSEPEGQFPRINWWLRVFAHTLNP